MTKVLKESPTSQNQGTRQIRKITAIRRTDVRETSVSRQHGGPIEDPPELEDDCSTIVRRGMRWAHNWAHNIPRDASLSDRRFEFPSPARPYEVDGF